MNKKKVIVNIKDALSGLRQFLATESFLKMIKNAFISPQGYTVGFRRF